MDYLRTDRIKFAVRDYCDQIAYGKSASENDVYTLAYSKVSDENINMCIESAAKFVAARARATHLTNLQASAYPTIPSNFLRLIDDSVEAGGYKARRLSYHERMGLSEARKPSEKYPAFEFEDCDLTIEGGTAKKARCVVWPVYTTMNVTGSVTGNLVSGGAWQNGDEGVFVSISDGTNTFESTVESVLTSGIVRTADISPVNITGELTYRNGQTRLLQSRLKDSIVMRTSELVLLTMGRPDLASVASENLSNALAGLKL